MRYPYLFIVLITMLLMSGCSMFGSSNILDIASQERIVLADQLQPDPEAERILVRSFTRSKVPWKSGRIKTINEARAAIASMGKYLQARLLLDSSLPYYTYKASAEFVQNQYNILQKELDARVEVKGAIPDSSQVIYYYVRRDILLRLSLQRQKIALTGKGINDRASQSTLEELKGVYKAIKPLVEMAL